MATLGSLVISLEANIAKFESAMTKAEYAAKKASDNIVGAFKGIGAGLAAAFSISALDKTFNSITTMESNLLKVANRLNTNVETLSSFSVMARKTGMDTDSFNMALTRMEKGLSAAAKGAETATGQFDEEGEEILKVASTYAELGLKAEILTKLPLEQQLLAMATAMKANIAPSDQVRIAMELFGRGGAGMVNILKEGPEAMQKWIDRATELGIITTDMAKRGAEAKAAAGDLSLAWSNFARELVDAVAPAITSTLQLLTDLAVAARKTAQMREDIMGGVHTGDFGEWGEGGVGATKPRGVSGSWVPEEVFTPPSRKPPGKGGGKGGGSTGEDRMTSIIDTLQKDLARLTEGSLAEIEAWAAKMVNEIEKVGKKGAETETALRLVAETETAKKKKAAEDYELFVAKESGDTYRQIEAEAKSWLEKYKGFAGAEENIAAIKGRKVWEEDVKNHEKRLSMQKGIFDSLAQESPILSQQLAWKEKILPLELELNRLALERMLIENKIEGTQADELRGLQALANQQKRTALERERSRALGLGGGLRLGAEEMHKVAETWAADSTEALLKSMPQSVSSSMVTFFVDTLKGKQTDFMAMGESMAISMVQKLLEGIMVQILPTLAQGVAAIFSSMAGGGGGGLFGSIFGGISSIGGALLAPFTGGASTLVAGGFNAVGSAFDFGGKFTTPARQSPGEGGVTIIHNSSFNNYPTSSEMRRVNRRLMQAAEHEARRRG